MTVRKLAAIVAAGVWASACASGAARTSAAIPLHIPDPPPREVLAPVAMQEKPEPEPPAAPEPAAPAAPASTASGNGRSRPVAAAPAPTPTAPPPPPAPAPAPTAATELRPAGPSGNPTISAQQLRDIVNRTSQKLGAIDRRRLSAGKQNDYDAARRFLAQADTAVKANDLLLAQSSAEKAEALADGLR